MADIPLHVISDYTTSERRITPSWSITTLKAKLETVTGIPPSCQRLTYKTPTSERIPMEAADEDNTVVSVFPLARNGEIHVADTRPVSARPNFNDTTGVEKYVMPIEEYERKTDSVLAWKKTLQLGRFDPDAPSLEATRLAALEREVNERGIAIGKRCRVDGDAFRVGVVRFVGEVPEIPGDGVWVGVRYDEPVGKNDGSVGGKKYWEESSSLKHGVFLRPNRVEVGDFPVLDDLEEMEEI